MRPEQGGDTGNVRASHGSSTDGQNSRRGSNPGGSDITSGGENINAFSPVGERGASVSFTSTNGGGSNGDDIGSTGRGSVASVLVFISSGNDYNDTLLVGIVDGSVKEGREATTQGHVDYRRSAPTSDELADSPINSSNDTRVGSTSVVTQDLNTNNGCLLGETVVPSNDGGRNVGTVSIGIGGRPGRFSLPAEGGTSFEVIVGNINSGVDDIDGDSTTSSGRSRILRVEVHVTLRNTSKSPRTSRYGVRASRNANYAINFNSGNIWVGSDSFELFISELSRVTTEGVFVLVEDVESSGGLKKILSEEAMNNIILVADDILSSDGRCVRFTEKGCFVSSS